MLVSSSSRSLSLRAWQLKSARNSRLLTPVSRPSKKRLAKAQAITNEDHGSSRLQVSHFFKAEGGQGCAALCISPILKQLNTSPTSSAVTGRLFTEETYQNGYQSFPIRRPPDDGTRRDPAAGLDVSSPDHDLVVFVPHLSAAARRGPGVDRFRQLRPFCNLQFVLARDLDNAHPSVGSVLVDYHRSGCASGDPS